MAAALLADALRRRGLQRSVLIDSAGTHASQPGHPADGRARQVCARERISLSRSRARQVTEADFNRFDYILAADTSCLDWLRASAPPACRAGLSLLGDWAEDGTVGDIPDPYYGSLAGFEDVLVLLRRALDGFLPQLAQRIAQTSRGG
ncbi:MAG: low molecular weight phosphotyrosine protein phosphatase [Halioglobus sp.]|nr:low molecular weight phosphotyrosine protein phosphatase [Halioglobus sp.]